MAPLVQLEENRYILELFHGPTLAFKDFAMLLLAELFDLSLKKEMKKLQLLVQPQAIQEVLPLKHLRIVKM